MKQKTPIQLLARQMNGKKRGREVTKIQKRFAIENGYVILYAGENDTICMRGVHKQNFPVFLENNFVFDNTGAATSIGNLSDAQGALLVRAVLGEDDVWRFITDIPHEKFNINHQDGSLCCVGIVFEVQRE